MKYFRQKENNIGQQFESTKRKEEQQRRNKGREEKKKNTWDFNTVEETLVSTKSEEEKGLWMPVSPDCKWQYLGQ